MNRIISILAAATLVVCLTGCYYDKEELVYPRTPINPGNCDTANLRYAGVQPIFQTRCYNCHSGPNPDAALNLDQYNSIKASGSEIIRRITLPETDIEHMPYQGPMLPPCELTKIQSWINNGAPQ